MDVILLERIHNLGQMGDVVKVRPGYARNFLLPQKKALRANENNKKVFEAQRAELEARDLEKRKEAEAAAAKINGRAFVLIRQASEAGMLYGSVSSRDIADAASEQGVQIARSQVRLDKPLKSLGVFKVHIALHPDVDATIDINVARSEEEAERQARGENVFAEAEGDAPASAAEDPAEAAAEAEAPSEEFFEEGAAPSAETGDADTSADNGGNKEESAG